MEALSSAEMHRRHMERQKRLWNTIAVKKAKKDDTRKWTLVAGTYSTVVDPLPSKPEKILPMWQTAPMNFNHHVLAWEALQRKAESIGVDVSMRDELAEFSKAFPTSAIRRKAEEIVAECIEFHGVSWDEMNRRSRKRHVVRAKHYTIYEIYKERPDMSLPVIGKIFGMDHTSIIFAVRKMQALEGDPLAADWVEKKTERMKEWFAEVKRKSRAKGKGLIKV
jgi:Bacterial dnaA protein helix-turn-helix